MIAYGDNIKIFCGNSNPQFAETICRSLGVPLGRAEVKTFADRSEEHTSELQSQR